MRTIIGPSTSMHRPYDARRAPAGCAVPRRIVQARPRNGDRQYRRNSPRHSARCCRRDIVASGRALMGRIPRLRTGGGYAGHLPPGARWSFVRGSRTEAGTIAARRRNATAHCRSTRSQPSRIRRCRRWRWSRTSIGNATTMATNFTARELHSCPDRAPGRDPGPRRP